MKVIKHIPILQREENWECDLSELRECDLPKQTGSSSRWAPVQHGGQSCDRPPIPLYCPSALVRWHLLGNKCILNLWALTSLARWISQVSYQKTTSLHGQNGLGVLHNQTALLASGLERIMYAQDRTLCRQLLHLKSLPNVTTAHFLTCFNPKR